MAIRSDIPKTAKSLPFALIRARERVMAPIRKMLARSDITEQQWRILRTLAEHGPLEATRLAELASLPLPSQTRILHSMEKRSLVKRLPDPVDRRRQSVRITPNGQAIIDRHRMEAAEIAHKFEEALGANDFAKLLRLLDRLSERLQ